MSVARAAFAAVDRTTPSSVRVATGYAGRARPGIPYEAPVTGKVVLPLSGVDDYADSTKCQAGPDPCLSGLQGRFKRPTACRFFIEPSRAM